MVNSLSHRRLAMIKHDHGIPVLDLFSMAFAHQELHLQSADGSGDVHFKKAGYELLGEQIVRALGDYGIR
jgi:hypothetical protein